MSSYRIELAYDPTTSQYFLLEVCRPGDPRFLFGDSRSFVDPREYKEICEKTSRGIIDVDYNSNETVLSGCFITPVMVGLLRRAERTREKREVVDNGAVPRLSYLFSRRHSKKPRTVPKGIPVIIQQLYPEISEIGIYQGNNKNQE